MNTFGTDTKIILQPTSLTVQIGSNVTFDCAGQDDGTGPISYQWALFDSNRLTTDRRSVGPSDFTSLSIPNVQFTTQYAGVRCVFGIDQSSSTLLQSRDANITLVGWLTLYNIAYTIVCMYVSYVCMFALM